MLEILSAKIAEQSYDGGGKATAAFLSWLMSECLV